MVLPKTIAEASPLDPLLLLPLPATLPASPAPDIAPLVAAISAHLDSVNDGTTTKGDNSIPTPLITAHMRQVTRHSQVLLNAARVGAAQGRERLDAVDGDLRGVEYELERVREEMERCMEYQPMYASMDIPDIKTFSADADPSLLAALPMEGDETREYALIIAQLENELAEITKREELLDNLTRERDAVVKSKREVKSKFDAVDVWLADFSKTSNAMSTKIKDVAKVPVPVSAAVAASALTPLSS